MTQQDDRKSAPDALQSNTSSRDSISKYVSKDLLDSLVNNPFESLILVDAKGIVRFVNNSYEQVYSRRRKDFIGRYVTEVAPESLLPEVLKTGKVIIGCSKILEDKSQIVIRIPLRKNGKLTGALGKVIFAPSEAIKELTHKLAATEQDLRVYKEEFKSAYSSRYTFDDIIGNTSALRQAKDLGRQCARSDVTVLILGESGSGKELFAHAIHSASSRRENPFVSVNCTTIPNELIESELFGYESGSFTGSLRRGRKGKFERADTGTIHLDEIGDMPYLMQSKLLRVLQGGEIEKIGQFKPRRVDFRLICTTNQPLEQMVEKHTFRLDLFYRINVVSISIPPLRQIQEDIPLMVHHFLGKLQQGKTRRIDIVSDSVMNILKQYTWPGNVRELKNVLERAIVVCQGDCIEIADLPPVMQQLNSKSPGTDQPALMLKDVTNSAEQRAIIKALKISRNNKSAAARLLGIHRTALYQKLIKYGISV